MSIFKRKLVATIDLEAEVQEIVKQELPGLIADKSIDLTTAEEDAQETQPDVITPEFCPSSPIGYSGSPLNLDYNPTSPVVRCLDTDEEEMKVYEQLLKVALDWKVGCVAEPVFNKKTGKKTLLRWQVKEIARQIGCDDRSLSKLAQAELCLSCFDTLSAIGVTAVNPAKRQRH